MNKKITLRKLILIAVVIILALNWQAAKHGFMTGLIDGWNAVPAIGSK